jgi:hypothetical protein
VTAPGTTILALMASADYPEYFFSAVYGPLVWRAAFCCSGLLPGHVKHTVLVSDSHRSTARTRQTHSSIAMFFVFVTRVQRDDETQPLIESFDCIFRMVFVWWTSQGREKFSMKLIRSF